MRAILFVVTISMLQGQSPERKIQSDSEVGIVEFSPDGSSVAGLCRDNKIRHWDGKTGALQKALTLEKVTGVSMASATTAASTTPDGGITLWNLLTGEKLREVSGAGSRANRIAVAGDQQLVAGGTKSVKNGSETTVHLWDATGRERFAVAAGAGGLSATALSPDGSTLVAASYDTDVRAWSTRDGELVKLISEIPVATFALQFTPDGKYLAAAGVDQTVYIYDAKSWKLVRKLLGQPEMISALAFSRDGKTIVTGGFNELTVKHPTHILLWDFASGKVIKTIDAPRMVTSAAFSPDGKTVAVADREKVVRLLPVAR